MTKSKFTAQLLYKGHPVYVLDDDGSESWTYFAFVGTKEDLKELRASLKGGKTKASWEEEHPIHTSRPYDRGKMRLRKADLDEADGLAAIPVIQSFTPKQLGNIRTTFERLQARCEKMNPGRHFSL